MLVVCSTCRMRAELACGMLDAGTHVTESKALWHGAGC